MTMKFTIANEHIQFFRLNGWIELEQMNSKPTRAQLRGYAEIAQILSNQTTLRFGFQREMNLEALKEISLEEWSSVKPVHLGLALYPSGNGVFFRATEPVQFVTGDVTLIAFVGKTAQYIENRNDPQLYDLKKLGYGYGDHLKNDTHPILCG